MELLDENRFIFYERNKKFYIFDRDTQTEEELEE